MVLNMPLDAFVGSIYSQCSSYRYIWCHFVKASQAVLHHEQTLVSHYCCTWYTPGIWWYATFGWPKWKGKRGRAAISVSSISHTASFGIARRVSSNTSISKVQQSEKALPALIHKEATPQEGEPEILVFVRILLIIRKCSTSHKPLLVLCEQIDPFPDYHSLTPRHHDHQTAWQQEI